eukprot:SAG25_NODE_9472_length_371_cov_0.764706_1_plen_65_part_01
MGALSAAPQELEGWRAALGGGCRYAGRHGFWERRERAHRAESARAEARLQVGRSCACIGSPCLRH